MGEVPVGLGEDMMRHNACGGLALMLLGVLAGCGGARPGETVATGSAAVIIVWPTTMRDGQCLLLTLTHGEFSAARQLDRPTGAETSTILFDAVPAGLVTVRATAYPGPGATGVPQGSGMAQVTVPAGGRGTVTMTLRSTVAAITLSGPLPPLIIGQQVRLTAYPVDAQGHTVLIGADRLRWTSAHPAIAGVDATGLVTAVGVGTTTITVTETGSGVRATAPVAVTAPVTGGHIAFLSNRDGNDEVYVMAADGGNVRRLTQTAAREDEVAISADGRQVAYISRETGGWEVYTLALATGTRRRLTTSTASDWGPSFSPDGAWLAYFTTGASGTDDIYLMSPTGDNVRRLTNHPAMDVLPVFAPDGGTLYFNSDRAGAGYDLYRMNVDGSGVTRLTTTAGDDWYHAISPDGRLLAFTADGHLDLMLVDGSNRRTLTRPTGYQDVRPTFSPDGTRLAFASNRDDTWQIYVMDLDSGNLRQLTTGPGDNRAPSWGK